MLLCPRVENLFDKDGGGSRRIGGRVWRKEVEVSEKEGRMAGSVKLQNNSKKICELTRNDSE